MKRDGGREATDLVRLLVGERPAARGVEGRVMVFRWVYPAEVVIVAFLLACLPYLLIRGASNVMAAAGHR